MITNFSEESKYVLQQARRGSVGKLKPLIKEELVFYGLVDMQHPLWLIVKDKFKLNENIVKNTITEMVLKNNIDDPANKENLKKQKRYFENANKEAMALKSSFIEPYHLLKAIFVTEDNGIFQFLKKEFIKIDEFLKATNNISYIDLTEAINKADKFKSYAPSRKLMQTTEYYSSGLRLEKFGRNLNNLAKENKLDPVYFRDEEIQSTIEILCRKQQNNPLLVGEAGVGKTAIAEGIAQLITAGKVPAAIKDKEIIEISITSLVAGTTLRGEFEENMQKLIEECKNNPNIILFIDEIHMVVGAGGEKDLGDAANMLKPPLARGQLRCIGATTTKESRQYLEKDKALKRRFQFVYVKEPTVKQTIDILNKCKNRFEEFHGVKISDEAVRAAAELADKYIKDRHFPGKAIDLLDHTCARERIDPNSDKIVTAEEIAVVVAKNAQIPITQILAVKTNELGLLEKRLKDRVIGQDDAIKDLVEIIHMAKMGMDINPQRPEGVFLFVGPTGVGKTELAKSLSMALLGDESRLTSFDMTEFKDEASINKLLGAAPGYIGYEQESRLVSSIRSNPNSIILLDEIEKANPNILSLLKQIFEKGTLSAPDGETVFFSQATFILTSNIGAEILKEEMLAGLEYEELCKRVKKILQEATDRQFSASFLNSIDKVIYFNPISKDCVRKIIENKIQMVFKRIENKGYKITYGKDLVELLLSKGYSIRFGAEAIDKIIEDYLLKLLTEYLLTCKGMKIVVSISKDKIAFTCG